MYRFICTFVMKAACCRNIEIVLDPTTLSYIYIYDRYMCVDRCMYYCECTVAYFLHFCPAESNAEELDFVLSMVENDKDDYIRLEMMPLHGSLWGCFS